MASHTLTATGGIHETLSGTTADTVTVPAAVLAAQPTIEVVNRSASTPLYVRSDGIVAVAAADGTVVVAPNYGWVHLRPQTSGHTISVVGDGNDYSVGYPTGTPDGRTDAPWADRVELVWDTADTADKVEVASFVDKVVKARDDTAAGKVVKPERPGRVGTVTTRR